MTEREIQQAMDACRPGSADLQQAEMAALEEAIRRDPTVARRYDRSQQFDTRVKDAFRNAPVPDGLEERLLAAVESAADGAVDLPTRRPSESPAEQRFRPGSAGAGDWPVGKRRRTWTLVAGGLVAVAALAGFVLLVPYFRVAEPRPDDRLPSDILAWSEAIVRQGWNEDLSSAQALGRPLDRAVRANPQRWCAIPTAYDSQTVVYDVAPRGTEMALVFCMRCPVSDSELPQMPPLNAFSATGGLTLGVWRRGDLVYVLAVRGGPSRYRSLIEASPLIGLRSDAPCSLTATV